MEHVRSSERKWLMPPRRVDGAAARPVPTLDSGRTASLRLEPVPLSARSAREFVRRELRDEDPRSLDTASLDTVLLVATELVTNAVLHARSPIDLTLEVDDDQLLVKVFDCDEATPQERPPDVERQNGRGIALVSTVSASWGTVLHDGGKTVWAVVARSAA
jgi:two-component sensor histidine kinase